MWTKIGKLAFLLQTIVFGAELNFIATINRTEIGLGDAVTLTVSVEGENIGKVPSPQLPDLPDFDIRGSSSSQSTNIQLVNGRLTQKQTIRFIYTLYPKKIGKLQIGACKLEYKDQTYKTQPIEIAVVKGKPKPPPSQPPAPGITPSQPDVPLKEDLMITAKTNRKNVYLGEQITIEFALYIHSRISVGDLNLAEIPSFNGFWVEPIFDERRPNFQRQSVQGKLYNVCLLKKSALFPMTTGKLKITPMKMDVAVVQPPRDFFDFFGTTRNVRIESDPVYISVKPLPSEDKPDEFTGGVGKFTIKASLDRTTSDAAEPINLIIKINGIGNIKLVEKPSVPSIPGVKILDPEIKTDVKITGNVIKGKKEFRYPLIPQTDGEHLIPKIKMAYFNPQDKKYHLIETEKLKFTATRTASAIDVAQKSGLKILGTDIHYIKPPSSNLQPQKRSADWWILSLYIISVAIIGLSLFIRRHQARLLTDRAYARKLRSSKIVRKGLKEAENYLKNNKETEFLGTLSRILLGYIGDRFNLDIGALTKEQLIEALHDKMIKEETIKRIDNLLSQCDMVRFSPDMKCKNPKELFKETKKVLNEL
jgi:hypothetical protein